MSKTPLQSKQKITKLVRGYFQKLNSITGFDPSSACLLWAMSGLAVFRSLGIRCLLQAGSASFLYVHPEDDDGVMNNSFSYVFETGAALGRLVDGGLPEMHAWLFLPNSNELVDFSVGYQPEQAKRIIGVEWGKKLTPPEVLWESIDELNSRELAEFRYRPDSSATGLAAQLIAELAGGAR